MQIKKKDIHNTILRIAKDEFLKKGFKNASMRNIAEKAEVGLSNIYNYFRNKDEIYKEVLSPLINEFDDIVVEHNSPKYLSVEIFDSEEYYKQNTKMFVDLAEKFRLELRLLLFYSQGSSLENFREEFIERNTSVGTEFLIKMKEKYPYVNINISSFFIHTISSWWVTIIGEIVTHDLTHVEIEQFISEYIRYGTAGWKKLVEV